MFEFIQLDTEKKLQNDRDSEYLEDFFKYDDFEATFEDNKENVLTIKGEYELNITEETDSLTDSTYFELNSVKFNGVKCYINDIFVNLESNELNTYLYYIENEITDEFEG